MSDRKLVLGDDVLFRPTDSGMAIHWEFFDHLLGMVRNSEHGFVCGAEVNAFDASRFTIAIQDIERDFSFDVFMNLWADPDAKVLDSLVEFLNDGGFEIVETDDATLDSP